MLNWYERSCQAGDATARLYSRGDSRRRGARSCGRRSHFSAAPTFPAPTQANSSSTCACPAARGWRSATTYIAKVENVIRSVVRPKDLDMIVSNIGVYPDLSAIYTTNASMDTAFVQTSLKEDHSIGSYEYMRRVREKLSREMPELSTYFQAGGLVDRVINQGLPAPIDIQVSSNGYGWSLRTGQEPLPKDQNDAECERRLHSAESELSGHCS